MKKKDTSWGSVAAWYDGTVSDSDSYQAKVIAPNLSRLMDLKMGDKVLDLACGTGYFSRIFAETVGPENVIGVDVGKELVDIAKKNNPRIKFLIFGADNLSFLPENSFDKIAVVLAIQNIENVKVMMNEIGRVLKNNGSVYIVMNHPAYRIPKRSSWGYDETEQKQYRRIDGYLRESKEEIDMNPGSDRPKEQLTVSFHRPLQYYSKLFQSAGFAIYRLEEWVSHKRSQSGPRQKEEDRMRSEIPLFLFMELKKCK